VYKLPESFAKPYFHKYWTEIHDVTTIWKRNTCSFIVTLNAFDVRPSCDTADVQAILPYNTFCTWPPRSPDLTECDFFLWGFVKDNIYVPPLPKTLPELRQRINTEIGNVTHDMLERGWREWEYCLDIAVSHEGRTSNAFKVTMKLQTSLFQMVVTSCISVQYLWKYGFAKSSDILYTSCTLPSMCF